MTQETLPAPQPEARRHNIGVRIAFVIVLFFLLCIPAAILVTISFVSAVRVESSTGAVEHLTWERTILIMGQGPVGHQDWQDSIPSDAQRGSCTRKVRSTQSQPAPGAEKVCGTPYAVGQGTPAQDCQYVVYDDWCWYTRNEWTVVNKAIGYGNDLNPYWPALNLKPGQREGERIENYLVQFKVSGKVIYDYSARDAAEFSRFKIGSRWRLTFDAAGKITGVQPAP